MFYLKYKDDKCKKLVILIEYDQLTQFRMQTIKGA